MASLSVVAPASTPPAKGAEPTCTVSAKLVNSCRPWFGAESGGYGVTGTKARMMEHEAGLKAATKYTYKVHALDAAGNWSGASANVSGTAR